MKTLWAITSLLLAFTLNAADHTAAAKTRPFHGTIKTINKPVRTIVLKGDKAQTFRINAETRINRDGKPVSFDDITVGDVLGGFARQAPDGHWEAVTLNLKGKTPEAAGSPGPTTKPAPVPPVKKPQTK